MNETITITGNVATEPQHRLAGGVPVTTFRVASGQRRFDKQAQAWVDDGTNWYTVSTWRSLAEHAFHSLRKGDRVLLTGRMRVRNWEAGEKKGTSVDIDAEAIGHDLLWGTSKFEKDARPAAASAAPPPDEWTTPGVTDAATEWSVAPVPPDDVAPKPRELAGVEAPF